LTVSCGIRVLSYVGPYVGLRMGVPSLTRVYFHGQIFIFFYRLVLFGRSDISFFFYYSGVRVFDRKNVDKFDGMFILMVL
jgi:hypothetical protein